MKCEQVSAHIWSLSSWVLIPVRVWVVVAEDGVTLVDAGLPFMAGGILRFIERLKAGPLRRVLLTHGHADHVGALKRILARTPVPVYAHRVELPYMEGQLPYPRRRKPEASLSQGIAQPLPEEVRGDLEPADPLAVGKELQAGAALAPLSGLRPYHTPGHSPGHVAYYHEADQVLLAGDLFTSRAGQLRRPMAIFTADMAQAIQSAGLLQELTPRRLEICHGGPVLNPADQLQGYLREAGAAFTSGGRLTG